MSRNLTRFGFACALVCIAVYQARAENPAVKRAQISPSQVANRVEIFVTTWCPYCKKLENYLRSRNIPFTRYDVERDPKGQAIYHQLGGGGVPITRIGSTVLRGFDEQEFDKVFKKATPPAATTS